MILSLKKTIILWSNWKKFFSEPMILGFFSWICDISSTHGAVSILNESQNRVKGILYYQF